MKIVPDTLKCPDFPIGTPVDENGCAYSCPYYDNCSNRPLYPY